jgi:hypothetical protein
MQTSTLLQLPVFARELGMNGEPFESFLFACKLKNCSPKTLSVYGERLSYLIRWALPQGKELGQLTKLDLQSYLTSLIDKVNLPLFSGHSERIELWLWVEEV